MRSQIAFTLIELLVVVAIIGILAVLAVPNFAAALTRSKIAKVEQETRSLFIALETYRSDHNVFPPSYHPFLDPFDFQSRLQSLTSPISYLSSIMEDPFPHAYDNGAGLVSLEETAGAHTYCYGRGDQAGPRGTLDLGAQFVMIASAGPDGILNQIHYYPPHRTAQNAADCPVCAPALAGLLRVTPYNPSNGVMSEGDIYRWSAKTFSH